ncbi:FG-GAP-like repeat-containing protein [Streptomyces sp. MUSC 125]|uniref:FG-GAP-like repeat-containing protein n=1 Tax=Streptomyces sp. MUSC 125 TaxID=1428624 RepID=UPI00131E92D8|nr:FG-GAP-like repeat-containing protein [Streptomyces sp. MUSC 125]
MSGTESPAKSRTGPAPRKRIRPRAWQWLVALLACTTAVTAAVLTAGAGGAAQPYDFNGDGIADLAVGLPGDTVNGHTRAGSVLVADGTSSGPASSSTLINQDSTGVPGAAETDDSFGQNLVSADFNNDGHADLAVSSPFEAINTTTGAGMLTVHYGTSNGLDGSHTDEFNEGTPGMPGSLATDHVFTYSLAAGDLNGDGYADLAIGEPFEGVNGHSHAGTIKIMFGSADGLSSASTLQIDESTAHVPGTPEAEDRFGDQVAIADVNGDGTADLISATTGEQISGSSDRGSIHVMYGPITIAPASDGYIDSGNIDGIGEFAGSALAVGHFNNDPYADVAVGVPGQEVGDQGAAGRVAVFYGTAHGLSADDMELFDEDTPGVAGAPESSDRFGTSLAAGDFDGDGVDDLIVGVGNEAIGSTQGAGAAVVLFGNATGGITAKGSIWVDQSTPGVPGTIATDDHFGWTVGALDTDGDGRVEPLIGAPGNAAGTVTVLKVKPATLESATAYAQSDLGGATGIDGDAFGIALPH